MKVSPQREEVLTLYFFLIVLAILLVGSSIFFDTVVLTEDFNLFPILASTILISLFPLVRESVVRKEVYKLFILAAVLIPFSFIKIIPLWAEFSMFNFYSIMYGLFFYCYLRSISITRRFLQGYIYVINFFLFFYFLLYNVEVVINNFFYDAFHIYIMYVALGIKVIMLFVTLLTFVSLLLEQIALRNSNSSQSNDSNIDNVTIEVPVEECASIQNIVETNDAIIAKEICLFFENNRSYLDNGFSIGDLCEALSISNKQIVSRVISQNLNTTFYKLVARYRINYSLTLLQDEENWTLDAISNSCGFKSINTFKKYFINYVGLSPYSYRINGF